MHISSAFCFHDCSNFFYLFAKCFQILVHTVLPLFQWIGTERTIKADAWTERNSHIQAVTVLIVYILKNLSFSVRNGDCQRSLLWAYHVTFSHLLRSFCIFHSGLNQAHGKFRRTDAGKISPRKSFARQFYKKFI